MNNINVSIDIGNGYIKGIVVGEEEDKKILLVKESVKTKGLRKGKILDINELAKSIGILIESFEKKIGEGFIDEVIIGVSHPNMIIKRVKEQKRILDKKIIEEDINHLNKVIQEFGGEPNYEMIFTIPVTWIIDDEIKVSNPLDMEGGKLELIADIFMIPRNYYNGIVEIFDNLGISIKEIVPNILGSSEVCLDIDSKDLGVCLIDIGSNQTSFVVYEEGIPLYYGVLPYGGEDVTKDISIGLKVDISEAERIKRQYGILTEQEDISNESLDVKFVSDIIIARYEDVFEKVNQALVNLGRDGKLAGGIVLIGGGAKVKNIDLVAKEIFKLAVFFGKDKVVKLGDISNNLQFINVIGVYWWVKKYINSLYSSNYFDISGLKSFVGKIIEFIKKLF